MAELDEDASEKVKAFVQELAALCAKHGMMLSVSGYDALQVWTLREGEPPIYATCIEDKTK